MQSREKCRAGTLLLATLLVALWVVACGPATVETNTSTAEAGEPPGDSDPGEPQTVEPKDDTPPGGPPNPKHLKSAKDAVVEVTDENSKCDTDADCVKNACCHATACVNKEFTPQCDGVMCTLDCRGGTMDCGWGKCLCVDGKCTAEIKPPPKPPIKGDPKPPLKPE